MVHLGTGRNLLTLEQPIDKPLELPAALEGKGGRKGEMRVLNVYVTYRSLLFRDTPNFRH